VEKSLKAENGDLTTTPPSVWAGQRSSLWMTVRRADSNATSRLLRQMFARSARSRWKRPAGTSR